MRFGRKQISFTRYLFFASVVLCPSLVHAQISGFDSFSGFTVNQDDSANGPTVSNGSIRLVTSGGEHRSIFYDTPQNISTFAASFTYQATGGGYNGDGACFVLQNSPSGASCVAIGSYGYGGFPGKSIGVTLETNGSGSGYYTDGNYSGGSFSVSPINFLSGDPINVTLSYNGSTLQESLLDTKTSASYSTSYLILNGFPTVLGGSTAYVGLAANTYSGGYNYTFSNFQFTSLSAVSAPPTWQAATWLGDWNVAANWTSDVVPNSAGAQALFQNTTGSAQITDTNVPITLGILDLTGSNSSTITGVQGVGLTMQTTGGSTAQINVSGGTTHEINLPLTFASNAAVIVASGSTMEIGNSVTVNADLLVSTSGAVQFDSWLYVNSGGTLQQNGAIVGFGDLLKNGPGTLILSGNNTYAGGTEVLSGRLVATNGQSLPYGTSLTVGAGGTFIFDPSVAALPVVSSASTVAVPEPGTLALLTAAICGAIICQRMRSRWKK